MAAHPRFHGHREPGDRPIATPERHVQRLPRRFPDVGAYRVACYSDPNEANVGGYLMVALKVGFLRSLRLGVATEPPTDDVDAVSWPPVSYS